MRAVAGRKYPDRESMMAVYAGSAAALRSGPDAPRVSCFAATVEETGEGLLALIADDHQELARALALFDLGGVEFTFPPDHVDAMFARRRLALEAAPSGAKSFVYPDPMRLRPDGRMEKP